MNSVRDIDGDWFTMPPEWDERFDAPTFQVPAVGDVLANTVSRRASDGAPVTVTEWADPPFLLVTRVAQFVTIDEADQQEASYHGPECVVLSPNGYCTWQPAWDGALEYDDCEELGVVPGAVPGGWAIRVEPILAYWAYKQAVTTPPPTERPLNQ